MARLAGVSSRRILLVVTGLSPQVLTETLYALALNESAPFVPGEVHLITTSEGAERARLTLLGSDPGWFNRLCAEYGLSGIRFDEGRIHVLQAADGAPLADIRTGADNQLAADQIAGHVRQLTADPATELHVSVAGGRKTMGFFAGYALSLFGRPQDCLSHVLVSAPFESHPEFFYPTRAPRIIYTPPPDSRPLDTSTAQVTLADIPFLRLRNMLPQTLPASAGFFASLIGATQATLDESLLVLDEASRRVRAGGVLMTLPPAEFAFLSWFARRRMNCAEPLSCPRDGAPEPSYAQAFLSFYVWPDAAETRTRRALRAGMDKSFFLEHKSRLTRLLCAALGPRAFPYLLETVGRRPDTRYQLRIPPAGIRFEPISEESFA